MGTRIFKDSLEIDQFIKDEVRRAIGNVPRNSVDMPSTLRYFLEDLRREQPRNTDSAVDKWAFVHGPLYIRRGGCVNSAIKPFQMLVSGFKATGIAEPICLFDASNAEEETNHELNKYQNILRYDSPVHVFDLAEYAAHKQAEASTQYAVTVSYHKQRRISERKRWVS